MIGVIPKASDPDELSLFGALLRDPRVSALSLFERSLVAAVSLCA